MLHQSHIFACLLQQVWFLFILPWLALCSWIARFPFFPTDTVLAQIPLEDIVRKQK